MQKSISSVMPSLVAALVVSGVAIFAATSAHAQAYVYNATEAKLQVFVSSGISVSADPGMYPISSYSTGGGATLPVNYTNNVSSGGITTGVVVDGRATDPVTPSFAGISYNFTPAVFLTNNTDSYQPYNFIYNISFGHSVNAQPNGGDAYASTTTNIVFGGSNTGDLNTFYRTLTQTNGSASENIPFQLGGSNGIAPHSTIYMYVRTSVSASVRYSPLVVPEAGTLGLVIAPILLFVAYSLRVSRKRQTAEEAAA